MRKICLALASTVINNRFFEYYKKLEHNQWLDSEAFAQLQLAKLKKLINYAKENIPFYKKRLAGSSHQTIQSIDDMKMLPAFSKQDLAEAGKDAVAKGGQKLMSRSTSGTTGPPFHFVISHDFFSLGIARHLRIFDLAGLRIGDPWVIFTPLRYKTSRIYSFLTSRLVLDANRIITEHTPPCCPTAVTNQFQPDEKTIRKFCEKIKAHKPIALYSYPSTLIALATFIRKWAMPGIKIKTIISSGEVLTQEIREFLEKTFDAEIFNLYGTTEFPTIAEECQEHNGLHVFGDSYLVEFLHDGEIVITDLDNYTMPFIRFRTGDHGYLKNTKCWCGKALPLMEITKGRVSDLIITPDGKFLRRSFFAAVLKKNPEVKEFKIVQNEKGKILLSLAVSNPLTLARREFLMKRFREYAGASITINIDATVHHAVVSKALR